VRWSEGTRGEERAERGHDVRSDSFEHNALRSLVRRVEQRRPEILAEVRSIARPAWHEDADESFLEYGANLVDLAERGHEHHDHDGQVVRSQESGRRGCNAYAPQVAWLCDDSPWLKVVHQQDEPVDAFTNDQACLGDALDDRKENRAHCGVYQLRNDGPRWESTHASTPYVRSDPRSAVAAAT
jgi:hypothetical protein